MRPPEYLPPFSAAAVEFETFCHPEDALRIRDGGAAGTEYAQLNGDGIMPFITRTGARAVMTIGLTLVSQASQLARHPIYSQPDPVTALAQATLGSSVAISNQLAHAGLACGMLMAPRNIPNFATVNSLATADRMAIVQFPTCDEDTTSSIT